MVRVTAIVSAYQADAYLLHKLENLRESDQPIKIALLETGSKPVFDKKCSLVDYYQYVPDKITIYSAWNHLIKSASTPYVVTANCDDLVHPMAYRLQADALDVGNDISYFDYYITKGYCKTWSNVLIQSPVYRTPIGGYSVGHGLGPFPMWRKSLHDEVGYFDNDLKVFGDSWFWTLLQKRPTKWCKVDGVLGAYAQTGHNLEVREGHLDEDRLVVLRKSL